MEPSSLFTRDRLRVLPPILTLPSTRCEIVRIFELFPPAGIDVCSQGELPFFYSQPNILADDSNFPKRNLILLLEDKNRTSHSYSFILAGVTIRAGPNRLYISGAVPKCR